MKKITLLSLTLQNFKGIRDLTIQFGNTTNIFGANESGKSTICTAFYWLLTGKDEFDRNNHEIKNTAHKDLNDQPHEVSALISINGSTMELKRVYIEKWTKPRGQSKKVFEGHATEYYINGVACRTASEYQDRISEIIPAEIIKLVTNPSYFNNLKPEDQRRGLLKLVGEITNDEIIDSIAYPDRDFSDLINVLNSGKKLEDYKKELAAKRLVLKKEAVEFAPRIEEATRNKPEALDWDRLGKEIADLSTEISTIDDTIADASKKRAEKEQGITSLKDKRFNAEQKIEDLRRQIKAELLNKQNEGNSSVEEMKRKLSSLQADKRRIEADIQSGENRKENYQRSLEQARKEISSRRENWETINSEKFEFDEEQCVCPTCKRQYDANKISTSRVQLLKNFNEDVQRRKNAQVQAANEAKAQKADLEGKISHLQSDLNVLIDSLATTNKAIESLQAEINAADSAANHKTAVDFSDEVDNILKENASTIAARGVIQQLNERIESENAVLGSPLDFGAEKARKAELQSKINDINKQLGLKETILQIDARIEDLKNKEEANAQEIASLEQREFDLEAYGRAKMDILEERVNAKFQHVRFRLFEQQVNGGVADTCVCEYRGVPYPTLNTAARMLAGIDVLNTFSKHFQILAPVFVDNRESITHLPDSESQIISLIVSPTDRSLRVEAEQEESILS